MTTSPLLGRASELAVLEDALSALTRGRGGILLIAGEAGIGKSRLVGHLVERALELGTRTAWGQAWEAGGAPAYWLWTQGLRAVLGDPGAADVLARTTPDRRAALAALLPELAGPDAPPLPNLGAEQARFRLCDAATDLLCGIARQQPTLVVLEDLHAADPDSVFLLHFLVARARAVPLLCVATYREHEAQRPPIGPLLQQLRRQATELRPRRLAREEVHDYLRAATGRPPLAQTVAWLFAVSEGLPLYLSELVDLLRARGGDDHVRRLPIALPLGLRSTILERARHLPAPTRRWLELAAVIGRRFTLTSLAALTQPSPAPEEIDLEAASEAGLVERLLAGTYRFTHILVREAFHAALDPAERCSLHLKEAARLERLREAGRDIRSQSLAHHLAEAGPAHRGPAQRAWSAAAAEAHDAAAFDDAVEFRARALEMLLQMPDPDPAERAAATLELGRAQIRIGDLDSGRRHCREAFDAARRLADPETMARAALAYAEPFVFAKVDDALLGMLREALTTLGEVDLALRARLLARLAAAMQPATDPAEPIALARQAVAMARAIEDPPTLLATLRSAISALMDLGDPAERLALNREHVRLADTLGDTVEVWRGWVRIVIDATELADPDLIVQAIEAADTAADRLNLPHYRWPVRALRGMRALVHGDFDTAERLAGEAAALAEHAGDVNARRTLALQHLGWLREREDTASLARFLPSLQKAMADTSQLDAFAKPMLGMLAARFGWTLPLLEPEWVETAFGVGDTNALCNLAELAAAHADTRLAARLFERLEPRAHWCGHWGLTGCLWDGPVARALALLAIVLGRPEDAERHFELALARTISLQAEPMRARISVEFGGWLAQRGETQRARPLIEKGRALAQRLSLPRLTARAEALCQDLEDETGPPPLPATASPAGVRVAAGGPAEVVLVREGAVWHLRCGDEETRLPALKGLEMLAELLRRPGRPVHVLDLGAAGAPADGAVDLGDAGEHLDAHARNAYRTRLGELEACKEEALELGDHAAAELAETEIEFIARELGRAFGLDGRGRRSGSAAERARVNATRRIRDAIRRIAVHCPRAGAHLEHHVRTGTFCCYEPS